MKDWAGLDYLMLAIVAVSVIASLFKGFVRELISLGAAVVGVLFAFWEYARLAPWFTPYVKAPDIASLAAFVSILVAALVAGAVLSSFAVLVIKKAGLEWFDRLLGAAFGLVRGLIVALAIVLGLLAFPPGTEVVERSHLAPYLVLEAKALAATAPEDIQARFRRGLERAQQNWKRGPL